MHNYLCIAHRKAEQKKEQNLYGTKEDRWVVSTNYKFHPAPGSKQSSSCNSVLVLMYSAELLMMGREAAWNMYTLSDKNPSLEIF
jgi:hypothetical protein